MAQTIFSNARLLLDGFDTLQPGRELLVEDGLIRAVSAVPLPRKAGTTVIDAGGRTLMPGLIDAHAHITGLSLTPKNIAVRRPRSPSPRSNYLRNCLMDGYTTIREAGGADHATARLLAEGADHRAAALLFGQGADPDRRRRRLPHARRGASIPAAMSGRFPTCR